MISGFVVEALARLRCFTHIRLSPIAPATVLERTRNNPRKEPFDRQDEIDERREALIGQLEINVTIQHPVHNSRSLSGTAVR
ncbi:MAG: hypothetical protein HOP34_10340 [Methylococcaceae bacterium]|nr:hypothetical protein [Methylococcaceae bacterium]